MFILIGEGRYIKADEVVAIVDTKTFIHCNYIDLAKQGLVIVDATGGAAARCIIFMKNNTAFLCNMIAKTIASRIKEHLRNCHCIGIVGHSGTMGNADADSDTEKR